MSIALQESEFELADYIKRGYDKVLKKLHLKKEHINDIQAAIQSADVNNDKFLDWDEWRNDLRMRGIPDNGIIFDQKFDSTLFNYFICKNIGMKSKLFLQNTTPMVILF